MDAFASLSQDEQVQRIELLGREALRQFGVEPVSVAPLVHAENTTYRVDAKEGAFCLRVCRPDYQSDANVVSEIAFLAALSEAGFDVPRPYDSRVVKAAVPEVPEARNCVLLQWQEGEFADDRFTSEQAKGVGRTMAETHGFSAQWIPPEGFSRQGLHDQVFERFVFESPVGFVEESNRQVLLETLKRSRKMLSGLERDRANFGLIHGDMHRGNVLFDGDHVRLIDFDDLGWAYWIADFAAALAYEVGKDQFVEVREAMLTGYAEVRPLPSQTDKLLSGFLRMRFMTMANWILQRTDNPKLREQAPRWIEMMVEGIRAVD
ncbi:hypothetical protein EON82_11405 [bacterium]|nr:MAG: hypothetical protein EON82_11405 [bacterium]